MLILLLDLTQTKFRAKKRIEKQRAEQEVPLAVVKASRKELHSRLKASITINTSCFALKTNYFAKSII